MKETRILISQVPYKKMIGKNAKYESHTTIGGRHAWFKQEWRIEVGGVFKENRTLIVRKPIQ